MRIGILALFSFFPSFLFSQDYIYIAGGSRIAAKMLEVNPCGIKYRLYNNPDSSCYSLPREFVVLVVYANGTYDMFSEKKIKEKRKAAFDSALVNYGKNIISNNLFEFFLGNVSLSYERIFYKGKLGIKIPVISSNHPSDVSGEFNKYLATGIDLNYYLRRKGRVRYFSGPSFETGQYRYVQNYYFNSSPYYQRVEREIKYKSYTVLTFNTGILFHFTPYLVSSLNCGVGFRGNFRSRPETTVKIGYSIGLRL